MLGQVKKILEMIRFSHTLFALPFALLGAVMAWSAGSEIQPTTPVWMQLVGILICMVGARSAAMAFNRLVDRKIDAGNPRTAGRHLPSGQLSVASVLVFTIATSALFVGGTLLFLPNWLPLALSPVVLAILFAYSYTKRFTSMAHFWLGVSLMLAPICAWLAIRGEFVIDRPIDCLPACVLGLAVMFWVAGFDIIYACQDFEFDRDSRLKSIPVRFGIAGSLRIAAICHFAMIVALCCLPLAMSQVTETPQFGWMYWIAIGLVAGLLAYEHWLVRPDDLTRVNIAFFNINSIISVGLFLVGTVDLLFV